MIQSEPTEAMIEAGWRLTILTQGRVRKIYLAMKALDPDFATRTDSPRETTEAMADRLMRDFYLSNSYDPKAVCHADTVKAAIAFTLATRTDSQSTDAVVDDARFLCERVRELETDMEDGVVASNYYGHVIPALARMESTLAALTSNPIASDSIEHCGYVYEPDDSSKGEA